jgi:phage regulator Rha-like protein
MKTPLEIVLVEREHCLDSRLLAKQLGYDHKVVLQSIRRHKARLEAKSALLQNEAALKHEGYHGATRQTYYMLTERQCLILAGSLKKGDGALEWQDTLIDAFLQARNRVRELETQQQPATPPAPVAQINSLWQERLERFNRETCIPAGYWCIFGMVAGFCWTDEFRGVYLIDEALPDGSIGLRWCQHLRERGFDMRQVKKYPHRYPDKRGIQQANIYPNDWLGAFWTWFHGQYLKYDYPEYLRTHTRALQSPAQRQLPPGSSQE